MLRPAALLTTLIAFGAHAAGLPADAEIHRILEERVQAIAGPEGGMGIVVGVLDDRGPRVIAYGDDGSATHHPLNGDTVFEIASFT
jgi:CubicO group peptidase (beta-lactamase class C family)